MRKLYFILIFCGLIGSNVFGQWVNVYQNQTNATAFPSANIGYIGFGKNIKKTTDGGVTWKILRTGLPDIAQSQPVYINHIQFLSDNVGFIGDFYAGFILKTKDGGATWEYLNSPSNSTLIGKESFQFLNESTGYRISTNRVYKTTDGGLSWFEVKQLIGSGVSFAGLSFSDLQNGRVFSYDVIGSNTNTMMYTTTDGGASWTTRNVPTLATVTTSRFINSSTGYVSGTKNNNFTAGTLLKTIDGGLTWTTSTFSKPIIRVEFFDSNFGVAVGGISATTSMIAITTDGGATWDEKGDDLLTLSPGILLSSVNFIDANTFIVGGGGYHNLLKSTNKGATLVPFAVSPFALGIPMSDVFAVNANVMFTTATAPYTSGITHIKKSTDGGQNWTGIPSQVGLNGFFALWFSSATTGYGAGYNGQIAKTTDGAQTWTTQSTGLSADLNDISFVGTTGFAVSNDGKILKTANGTTWTAQTTPVSTALNSIHVFDATHAIAVGNSNVILKTIDGINWTLVTSPTTSNFRGVHFPTTSIGYAVGSGGKIIKTTNGGSTWSNLSTGVTHEFYTVSFVDQNFGYAAGDFSAGQGIIMATNDGGATWNIQSGEGNILSPIKSLASISTNSSVSVGVYDVYVAMCSNPAFTSTPQSQSLTTGETIVLSSSVSGVGTLNYTWKKDGVNLNVNNPTLTITNAQVSHSGIYSLTVNDNCGTTTITGLNVVVTSPEPVNQPTAFNFFAGTNVQGTYTFTAPTTPPTGYVILRKTGSAPSDVPVDGVGYSKGSTIGTSTVAYVGPDVQFTDTGLTTLTTYHYAVFAYNGSGTSINYKTNSPLRGTSLATPPTSKPTNFKLTNATLAALSFSYNTSTDAEGYIVLRNKLSASADVPVNTISYTKGQTIGQATVVHVGNKVSLSFEDDSATPGWFYVYRVIPYRGSGLGINYLTETPLTGTSLSAEPANHISNITFSAVKSTSLQMVFTKSLDNPTGYVIIRKKGSASTAAPTDGVIYTAGQAIDDAIVAYVGPETNISETALDPGTSYYYSVFAFNGVGASTNYLVSPSINNLGVTKTLSASPEAIAATSVLYNSFTARWNPVIGAESYKIDVSSNETFDSFLENYNGKQTTSLIESIDNLKANRVYFYRVRSVNSGGESDNSNVIKAQTADVPPGTTSLTLGSPVFSSSFPSDEQTQKVNVTASGGVGSRRAKLYYRGITTVPFTSVDLSESATNSNLYEATISRTMLDDIGVQFYFVVDDAAYTATSQLATMRKSYSANNSPALNVNVFGGTAETYALVSFPLKMEDNSVKAVFESVLGEYDDTQWRLVRYQGGAYIDYPSFDKIELGKSYWFNSRNKVTVKAGVSSTPVIDQSAPFKLSLVKGWNQIASPYPFIVDWRDVLAFNGNPPGLGKFKTYIPNTQAFVDNNSLIPFSGGFIFSENNVDLNIPVTLKASSGRRAAEEVHSDISQPDWQLPIMLSQGHVVNELGAVGMNINASISKDEFDDMTVPRLASFLEFNNYHNEYISKRFTKDIVPTSDRHSWDLVIESNLGESDITMTWPNNSLGINDAQILLFHTESGNLLNMKDLGSFTFKNRGHNNFKVLFSADPTEKFEGTTMMGVAYPNPSSGEFHFKMMTEGTTAARVEVFDLVGRRIFEYQTGSTGVVTDLKWPAVDFNGVKVQNGIYIYKIYSNGGDAILRKEGKLILH